MDATLRTEPERCFRPHPRYLLLAVVGLVMTGAFLWSLTAPARAGQSFDPSVLLSGEGFFCASSLAMAVWFGRQALACICLTQSAVLVEMPLARPQKAEYGQIMSVTESGRGGNALVVLYHPRRESGMLDLDDVNSIIIPAVKQQQELQALLEERIPP